MDLENKNNQFTQDVNNIVDELKTLKGELSGVNVEANPSNTTENKSIDNEDDLEFSETQELADMDLSSLAMDSEESKSIDLNENLLNDEELEDMDLSSLAMDTIENDDIDLSENLLDDEDLDISGSADVILDDSDIAESIVLKEIDLTDDDIFNFDVSSYGSFSNKSLNA